MDAAAALRPTTLRLCLPKCGFAMIAVDMLPQTRTRSGYRGSSTTARSHRSPEEVSLPACTATDP